MDGRMDHASRKVGTDNSGMQDGCPPAPRPWAGSGRTPGPVLPAQELAFHPLSHDFIALDRPV